MRGFFCLAVSAPCPQADRWGWRSEDLIAAHQANPYWAQREQKHHGVTVCAECAAVER